MQGLISEEKVDSFNLPLYYPTSKKLQAVIEGNGYLTIERMDILTDISPKTRQKFSAQSLTSQIRSGFEGVIKQHFGSDS